MDEIVCVRWVDAFCDHEQAAVDELTKSVGVTTVGFLVRASETMISVAAEKVESDGQVTYRCTTTVPRAWLLEEPTTLTQPRG